MTGPATDFFQRVRTAKKIVVVDLAFLGDSVHTVPALRELKRQHPGAELHVISAPVGAEVMRLAPCVDHAWAVELHPQRRKLRDQFGLIRRLRAERFDLAVNFSGADRTVIWTAATGARWRLGHAAARWHLWNRWLIGQWVPQQSRELPVYEQRRQVLAAAGYPLGPASFDLSPPAEAVEWAENHVPAGAVHLSVNASSPFKEWPLEHWTFLCRRLMADTDVRIVATCGSAERERKRLTTLAAEVGSPRLTVLHEDLTVARLAAVLARCQVHVGTDSGVTHLAWALDVPTVSVFRDYAGLKEWAPRGRNHWHLTATCQCLHGVQANCAAAKKAWCLASIPPEAVAGLVNQCLE